jgi:hypothetical protein
VTGRPPDVPDPDEEGRGEEERITRRRFVAGSVAAFGAVVVWSSPWPFSDAAIGQLIESAAASPTGATGPTGGGGGLVTGSNVTVVANGTTAGTVAIFRGADYVTWPAGAFPADTILSLSWTPLLSDVAGFAAGSGVVLLTLADARTGYPVTSFNQPLTVHFASPAGPTVPAHSPDGKTWTPIRALVAGNLPLGRADGYRRNSDGSIDILTLHATYFGVLKDVRGPAPPGLFTGRYRSGALRLTWTPATDNSGAIASYQLYLNGRRIGRFGRAATAATLRSFRPLRRTSLTLRAVDPRGNLGEFSRAVTVTPVPRPRRVPTPVPAWAPRLLKWQQTPARRRGPRPKTPSPLPAWYAVWKAWRLHPYRVSHS